MISTLLQKTATMIFVTDAMYHADQLTDELSGQLTDDQLYEFPVEGCWLQGATAHPIFKPAVQALSALTGLSQRSS